MLAESYTTYQVCVNPQAITEDADRKIEDEITAQVMGDGLSIAFNPKYVLNVLKNVESERVYLECNSPINPCVIRPVDDESSFYLIVPMRIF